MKFKRIIKFRLILTLTTFMLLINTAKGQCPGSPNDIIDTVLLDGFCLGSNGTLTIVPNFPNLPPPNAPLFQYSIDGGVTFNPTTSLNDSVFANISPGTYYIYVQEAASPTSYECFAVIIPDPQDAITAVASVNQNLICHGDSYGVATVNAIGGILPYTYLWPTGETTNTAQNLWAGTQIVIVTDANGCTATDSVVITNTYNSFSLSLDTLQQVQCNGECNGEVSLTVHAGGVSPYTFHWSTGQTYFGPGLDTAFNLCQGGHQVIIADAYGCDTTIAFTIVEPPILYAQANSIQPVQCFGFDDGEANTWGLGGTGLGTYTYSWSPISNTNDTITNLPPGIYTAFVTDTNGCIASDTVLITEPTELFVDFTDSVYSYCLNTNSGSLCAAASGGTPGYNYAWDNTSQLTSCVTNLHAGIYTVSVIDARSCIAYNVFDLDSITNTFVPDSVNLTISDVTCDGLYDGAININSISGGFPPFSYDWIGPGYTGSGNIITGLYAGNYAVVIEDSNGCNMTLDADVLSPYKLIYCIDYTTDESCVGTNGSSCNGQAVLNITGGTSPYYYDNTFSGVFPILPANRELIIQDTLINELCNGTYTVDVTDINGCQGNVCVGGSFTANINSETQVYITSVKTINSLCFNTAQGSAWIDGGPDPLLNYTWESNNPSPPPSPSGIVIASGGSYNSFFPGNYWLVAHYANAASFWQNYVGCDVALPFTINPSNTISISPIITNVTCSGDADGSIDLNPYSIPIGSTFSFLWDTLTSIPYINITNEDQLSLAAGTYTVSITDPDGCILIQAINVWEPTPIITNFVNLNNVSCNGLSDGFVTALVDTNSGAGSFTYSWAPGGQTGATATVLSAGTYTVTVIDSNGLGCSADFNITIIEPTAILNLVEPNSFWGEDNFGNPYHISCNGESDGSIIASNAGGTPPISYSWNTTPPQTTSTATNLAAGTYILSVTDANGCPDAATVTLNEPNLIIPNITLSEYSTSLSSITHEISCFGLYDGWAVSHPTGGYPGSQGYSFVWVNNPNNDLKSLQDSAFNLPALYSYTVTVTDMNNCSQSATTSIFDQPVPFVADVTTTNYAGATHAPFAVNFIDNTISTDPFDFNWTWEDDFEFFPIGTISMDHDFIRNNIGSNQVYVVLTNTTTGCTDTVFFDIDVQGIPDINNVFTPNSDGINDEYSFGEYAMAEVVVNIYNRWGQLVYIWEGMDKAWRGVDTNGENVPEGVYFYVLQSDGEDGHYYEEKGTITLLR